MDKNIPGKYVRVYKDKTGFYPTPKDVYVSCVGGFRKEADTQLFASAAMDTTGGVIQAGSEYDARFQNVSDLAGTTLITTVKISTNLGTMYIHASDYTALVDSCNDCCGT